MVENYDFGGWATRNDLKCADGRTIRRNAFKDCDGTKVPLVWNHQHNSSQNILGHALLENRPEGVYAYCSFNDTEEGQRAKKQVMHGDISALSIFANKLKQHDGDVIHGIIREVSLVLAGANPGAFIDSVFAHGEDFEEEATIYMNDDMPLELAHAEAEETVEEEPEMANQNVNEVLEDEMLEHSEDGETIEDIFNTLNEKQKNAVYAIVGAAIEEKEGKQEEKEMKHNVFDNEETIMSDTLVHDGLQMVINDAKRFGSLKESYLQHAEELSDNYGIDRIEYLFPEAKELNSTPDFIKRPDGWVSKVMGAVGHTPFARIKTTHADITEDEARAKGYIKGKRKKEEVFGLLKRSTTPQTIYKKQKLDRDDVVDITDFDVIAWLKGEMRMMLDEEIARAILVGDGRQTGDDDKIMPDHIRPVAFDDSLYSIKKQVTPQSGESLAHAFINAAIKARKDYRGSGNPTLYTTEDMLADMLLLEDKNGRYIYKSVAELATTLRVKEIVEIPVMPEDMYGIIVNLADYKVGADKGGAVNMFDDFDIDYNQMKYLIETRCSGALVKPMSALVFKKTLTAEDQKSEVLDSVKPEQNAAG